MGIEGESLMGLGGGEEHVAMRIHILDLPAEPWQIAEMLEANDPFIKVAVDLELGLLAGGGEWHADCERALMEAGSRQENVWGGDWDPQKRLVRYESLINIRPRQGNFTTELADPKLRKHLSEIVLRLMDIR